MNVMLVLGTRPQIIKSALFIHLAKSDESTNLGIVHTGQHYDYGMTRVFFEELSLPDPMVNLNVGSGTHAEQTSRVIMGLGKLLERERPDLVMVPGDTNSTLAGALAATKLNIPVAHIEAGARSYDMRMPEEVNRRLTDHCSTLLFTPSENCTRNLQREGIDKEKIRQTGDTMYDVLLQQLPKVETTGILTQLNLKTDTYALMTTHRSENVDNRENLNDIVQAMVKIKQLTVVFPVHPRTRKQLRIFGLEKRIEKQEHIRLIDPQGYHETLKLIENARFIMTDSGGMQKEAFWLKTPCITLRTNTEWIETLELGANRLAGTDTEKIVKAAARIIEEEKTREKLEGLSNPFGNGEASQRMLEIIKSQSC